MRKVFKMSQEKCYECDAVIEDAQEYQGAVGEILPFCGKCSHENLQEAAEILKEAISSNNHLWVVQATKLLNHLGI